MAIYNLPGSSTLSEVIIWGYMTDWNMRKINKKYRFFSRLLVQSRIGLCYTTESVYPLNELWAWVVSTRLSSLNNYGTAQTPVPISQSTTHALLIRVCLIRTMGSQWMCALIGFANKILLLLTFVMLGWQHFTNDRQLQGGLCKYQLYFTANVSNLETFSIQQN